MFCGLFLLATGCRDEVAQVSRLNLDPDHVKYQTYMDRGVVNSPDENGVQTFLMADLDGNGINECINGLHQKLIGLDMGDGHIKARFEVHLADDQCLDGREPSTGLAYDFNGDGIDEIYLTTRALDRSTWHFQVMDPAAGEFILDVTLPLGEDNRRPYYWDGSYVVTGALQDADGQGNPGVVLMRRVGYDASLRGVCVVSPFDGRIIWEYVCGAQPAGDAAFVTDLDNDGRREIVFFSTAPDNLDGRLINGTTDNQSHLIVLSNLGQELMIRKMGSTFFNGTVRTRDLDGDGIQEIITTTYNGSVGRSNEIIIWGWRDKTVLARSRSATYFLGLAIIPGPRPATSWLVTGSDDGTISRYLYADGTLVRDRLTLRDEPRCQIAGEVDILPEPGPEIIANIGGGRFLVLLNQDLEPLAVFEDDSRLEKLSPAVWNRMDDDKTLVLGNKRAWWIFSFRETPFDWAGLLQQAGWVVLLLLVLVSVYIAGRISGRRGRQAEAQRKYLGEATDREALFRLQRELEDVNHQVVGKTKGLERLVWLLDASATGVGNTDELGVRIEQVMSEFQVTVHPRLLNILRLARTTNFEPSLVHEITHHLGLLYSRIQTLTSDGLEPKAVASARKELRTDWEVVRDGFLALRSSVVGYFTTDPVRMLQGMLLVREGDLERARVTASLIGDLDDRSRTLCHMDHGDLHFVFDNLIDNAIRAMRDSPSRNLILQVERKEGEVAVHVSDSGNGIPPEYQEKIFTGRYSSRQGGGLGLHRSREILHRWGGEIQLVHSFPGKGTTFIVKLSTANGQTGTRSMEARG